MHQFLRLGTAIKKHGFQGLAVSVLSLALLFSITGCKPEASNKTSVTLKGNGEIIAVNLKPKAIGAYSLIEIEEAEYHVSRGEVGEPGGTFFSAQIGGGPKTFNGWVSKDGTSSHVSSLMASGLTTIDPATGDVIPDLAKSVDVLEDNMTYVVTLRKGLKWSDGEPLTAKDVIFTWNTIYKKGLGNPSARDTLLVDGKFPEVSARDDLTIEFKTAKPFVPFKRRLGYSIAPMHVLGPIAAQGKKVFDASWGTIEASEHPEHFVSNGIWKLESYDPGLQRLTYVRNSNFHMVDKMGTSLPYLDRYVLNFVNDMNNMVLQFEQGNIDIYGVPGQYLTHVRNLKRPEFNLYNLGPTSTRQFIFFNLNPRKDKRTGEPLVNPIKSKWFNNTHFRQAVDWAINRDDIVSNIIKGVGSPAFTAESSASPFYHAELGKGHSVDLKKAKTLLKKGGFKYHDDGLLYDSDDHKVEFELLTNSGNEQRENMGVNIKEDLAKLGISVNFKPMEFNVLVGKLNETLRWEACILGLGGGSPLEPHDGANVWRSDGYLHMFNARKRDEKGTIDLSDRYPWEIEIDELFEKGAQTFDFTQRQKIYHRYQEIVSEQAPFIYLVSPLNIVAVRSHLHNVHPLPLGGATYNMEEIWITPKEGAVKQETKDAKSDQN